MAETKPTTGGYADVNGIRLYHEIYGRGEPLVLIHGGLTTISQMQGWVQPLAKRWQVIAVEMQGHGRTADTDRQMSFTAMGDDIAALWVISRFPSLPGGPFIRRRERDPRGDPTSGKGAATGSDLLALRQVRLVSGGTAGYEPSRLGHGRKHDANADGQVFKAVA